ncbi:MAG: hypothetical protein JXB32_10310 [Deltaproteobacteria bacterium]|nr:hypothetical protein [Deltaproteobacteria bacterium]
MLGRVLCGGICLWAGVLAAGLGCSRGGAPVATGGEYGRVADAAPAEPAAGEGEPGPPEAPEPSASEPATAGDPSATERIPETVSLQLELPSPADPRWLNATVEVAEAEWRIYGCISNLAGGCDRTRTCPLDGSQRAAYAAAVNAVWAMPRCEPLGFGPDYFRVELRLGEEMRRTWMPPEWLGLRGGSGPPEDGGPCLEELRLAWWIYETFDRCERAATPTAP